MGRGVTKAGVGAGVGAGIGIGAGIGVGAGAETAATGAGGVYLEMRLPTAERELPATTRGPFPARPNERAGVGADAIGFTEAGAGVGVGARAGAGARALSIEGGAEELRAVVS